MLNSRHDEGSGQRSLVLCSDRPNCRLRLLRQAIPENVSNESRILENLIVNESHTTGDQFLNVRGFKD
ncbi:hypothetical protein POX_c03841 [Penicillium oxalicum]|uniref:hypothetical protein n=1 Tax=Penicillium oxalicum TaxID=69781 RepID=UPI0020B79CFB|nr:hypothetical protein POX_c03841 [Penicillium oxalicum]KAI2790987.1 hypothetical protein POX_c03841 [Penicillium oxalicum]